MDAAQAAFSKFVSVSHDPKAAQLGEFVYANGTVSPPNFPTRDLMIRAKQLSFGISLFYDGPEPPQGLYDELLILPNTTASIIQGSFIDFIAGQFLPLYKRYSKPSMPRFWFSIQNRAEFTLTASPSCITRSPS